MASPRQIAANRINARRSTGPRTRAGKLRSRRNAIRHGLTARTVIEVLESPDDYRAFETAILAEYGSCSVTEHALLTRLASLLWRLRRATSIETGLLTIQADIIRTRRLQRAQNATSADVSRTRLYSLLGVERPPQTEPTATAPEASDAVLLPADVGPDSWTDPASNPEDLARCFLRLANLGNDVLDRLNRYETSLWKQAAQVIALLRILRA